jgi:FtsP/CotA-like multicopper oxidase with cupredoxin domain
MKSNSLWGTLLAPTFPLFLTNNPLPNGFPWGLLTAAGSDPYTQAPITGVIRSYDFTISRGSIAPDGYQKDVILVNNQYPGPAIEANWGDVIQVTVHNQITGPEEGTSLHWHGLLQKETPWYDGVPAVQQCPIAPGKSFTYQFRASLYGTTWYHSHYSAQYSGKRSPRLLLRQCSDMISRWTSWTSHYSRSI